MSITLVYTLSDLAGGPMNVSELIGVKYSIILEETLGSKNITGFIGSGKSVKKMLLLDSLGR